MNTYLFIWNPKNFEWNDIEQDIDDIRLGRNSILGWSCGNRKSIERGDRIFLFKLGTEPKGIVGSGYAFDKPFTDEHWGDENKSALYIDIDFDVLLNPEKDSILSLQTLKNNKTLSLQNWTPQASGIAIKPEIVDELEEVWFEFLANKEISYNPFVPTFNESISNTYTEGAANQILTTRYERNPNARKKCISHYGSSCIICGFNFEKVYGSIGKDFIHVHHLNQISNIKREYKIDPIHDLRPVCPNCHSMIHKNKTPYSIEEMIELLRKNSKS